MCKFLKDWTSFEKTDECNEEEVFTKIKEIMDKVPNESISFALSSMVIDGFKEGGSICKVSKEIRIDSEVPSSFTPF